MAKISAKYKVIYIIDPAQGEGRHCRSCGKVQGDGGSGGTLVAWMSWASVVWPTPSTICPEGYYVRMICECKPQLPLSWTKECSTSQVDEESVRRNAMLNHIVLMGRLTRDPELRRTGTGIAVASFTLAVDRDYAPQDGGQRKTDFIDIVAWRSTAEFVSKYFSKGPHGCGFRPPADPPLGGQGRQQTPQR